LNDIPPEDKMDAPLSILHQKSLLRPTGSKGFFDAKY
jgi:hypothetical protein